MKNPYKLIIALVASIFLSSCASTEKVKVKITANNPDIHIDGKYIGNTEFDQLNVYLTPGEHTIRATRSGWEPQEIVVVVLPKGDASVPVHGESDIQHTFRLNLKKKE